MTVDCPHPECATKVQRTVEGTIQHGVNAHYATVHPGEPIPTIHPGGA